MRAGHTPHSLATFPVYSAAFLSPNDLVLGGGGGTSKSGIKNKLRLYHIGEGRALELVNELELEKGEDAPMSMAAHEETKRLVCGVNSTEELQEKGLNENCRAFSLKDRKIELVCTEGTLPSGDIEDFQKVTVISPDGAFVAVAGRSDLSLLALSNLSPIAQVVHVPEGEIYDATFSATTLVVVTTVNLLVYALPSVSSSPETVAKPKSKKGKEKAIPLDALKLLRTVKPPSALTNFGNGVFRGARFHPKDPSILYTVTNTVPARSRNTKSLPRQGLVAKWNTEEWKVEKVRKVGEKGLTCFDVSSNGKFIGFGSSDCSIGLLDANTLAPAVTILKAHDFPPTTLRFNPTSTLLVSGSADNSIRIVSVPDSLDGQSWVSLILIVLTLLMILLAIAAQALIN